MAAAVEPISILSPTSDEAENRKKEAQHHFQVIKKAGDLVRVNSLKIGFHAWALKRDNLFGILGFETEKELQEATGVKDSTYFNVRRIAEAYPGVTEELFVAMKLSNAEALMDLPESKRLTEYWLRMAATDSIRDFREKLDKELEGKARPSDGREASTALKVSMPVSRKTAVEAGIKEYAKEVGVEDPGQALEMMVAEHKDGASLAIAMTKAITKIAELKTLPDSGISLEEAVLKLSAGLDEIVSLFQAALEAVQNLESEE